MTGPKWPTSGEIDILEGLSGRGCYHFYFGTHTRPDSTGRCTSISPGRHILGVDWQPATLLAITHLAGSPARQPATMRVAYVRAWSGS